MPHQRLTPALIFTEERLAQLRNVIPESFADGRVNWAVLRETLGDLLEDDGDNAEHFGLNWPGKRDARRLAALPSTGALVPAPGEGVDEATTNNLFIEGENLEVLKLLQKSYAGQVKMIYIDPPYNTGNDFVYEDDFKEPIETYLRRTGQLGEEGQPMTTNTRADGRFHSKWLSMMYPRLRVGRGLLSDDGLMAVSIDDNEVTNLRAAMNEVFGEENFIECFVWKKSYGGGGKEKYVVRQHEYILLFAKNRDAIDSLSLPAETGSVSKYYRFKDEQYATRGPYRLQPLEAAKSMDTRPNLRYAARLEGYPPIWPKRQWLWKEDRLQAAARKGEIVVTGSPDERTLSYKQYLRDEAGQERGRKPTSVLDGPYTQEGTKDLSELFEGETPLQFPKPVQLLKHLLGVCCPPDYPCTVLDFFAGSGALGQAVVEANQARQQPVRYCLVQLPQPVENGHWGTIADIAKERLRRVVKRMRKEKTTDTTQDLGFRVLRLAPSHFVAWQDYDGDNVNKLTDLFSQTEKPLSDGWTPDGLLIEVMLIEGFPLDSDVTSVTAAKKNRVRRVTSDRRANALVTCFDERVYTDTLKVLDLRDIDTFVCLDGALNDEAKLRLADRCLLKTI